MTKMASAVFFRRTILSVGGGVGGRSGCVSCVRNMLSEWSCSSGIVVVVVDIVGKESMPWVCL